jgi:hypothetical protein
VKRTVPLFLLLLLWPVACGAADGVEWGGFLKLRGQGAWPREHSLWAEPSAAPMADGQVELRLVAAGGFGPDGERAWAEAWRWEVHSQALAAGGDSWRRAEDLSERSALYPDLSPMPEDDDRRLLDLTWSREAAGHGYLVQRLDRAQATWSPGATTLRLGRQAVTWGNGLRFQPLDLVNPFSPSDVEREYKPGADMAWLQTPAADGDLQVLLAPRRDPGTGAVERDQSALAAKWHAFAGEREWDLVAAERAGDHVLGLGLSGFLGGAAWRVDAAGVAADDPVLGRDAWVSLVANLDYSWVWWGRNWYGFVEYFHNGPGVGRDDYSAMLADAGVQERLARGDLQVLGRDYLAAHVQVELHPLFNLYLTFLANLADPSALVQPYAAWSLAQDVELLMGLDLSLGGPGTEFGGIAAYGLDAATAAPHRAWARLGWYF